MNQNFPSDSRPEVPVKSINQLSCVRGEHIPARPLFRCCDLDINAMTLKLEGDLVDTLKMYLHAENEVARLKHSKLLAVDMYGK